MNMNYDTKSIIEVFRMIKEAISRMNNNKSNYIELEITTTDEVFIIKISDDEGYITELNNNIIIYNKTVISLDNIVKIKILTNNINDENLKNILLSELEKVTKRNSRDINSNAPSYQRRYKSRYSNNNIQDYIEKNYTQIEKINCSTDKTINNIRKIIDIDDEAVLNDKTILEINKKSTIDKVNINFEECNVINDINISESNVVKKIDVDKKYVLTNNSKEVEVAKPVKTEELEVVTSINTNDYDVLVNQSPTNVVKSIIPNKSKAVTNIELNYLEGTLGNINKEKQVIDTKTIDILNIEPINKYVDKYEINGKPLRIDPTGEKYVGVVLEDGTFEPLKIELKTLTVLSDETYNMLGNIQGDSQIKKVVEDIQDTRNDFVDNVYVKQSERVVKYEEENLKSTKDLINISSKVINNIVNQNETINVVTKEETELINSIQNIQYDKITEIKDIKTEPVIKNVELISSESKVLEDVKLKKHATNVVKSIKTNDEEIKEISKDNITGTVECAGYGIMVVNNPEDITIYSTSKISSIN